VAEECRDTLLELRDRRILASLLVGRTTELWTYNDAFPGPVIELWEGQRVTIDFANRLPLASTLHWHGLAVPPDQDGSPMDPVAPGAHRVYTFDVPIGSAGTYWYHPHAHQTTTLQVGHGLAAPIIVRTVGRRYNDGFTIVFSEPVEAARGRAARAWAVVQPATSISKSISGRTRYSRSMAAT